MSLFLLSSLVAFFSAPGVARAGAKAPIACEDLQTLRSLGKNDLSQVINPRTGDLLNYVVIGDGATGVISGAGSAVTDAEVIVLFPGTKGILPDWPIQMITNSTYSPDIKNDDSYDAKQDGRISLCHKYYLVLFDYPGVGNTSFEGAELTGDRIANDVDALLDQAADNYGIVTDSVSLVGWSLGTLYALKYAFLAPVADAARIIDDLVLIATKPGGNIDKVANGNQAPCVTTLFDALTYPDLDADFRDKIEEALFKLMFPYANQPPNNKAHNDDCTAEVDYDTKTVTVSVDYDCPDRSECRRYLDLLAINQEEFPWSETDGVSINLYIQERNFVSDWNYCHCKTAAPDYSSEDCSCSGYYTSPNSKTNGGVCKTWSPRPNIPLSFDCAELNIAGSITVINGPEDLAIQWTYGRQLAHAYKRKYGRGAAKYVKYRGRSGAGHAVLAQHPKWMQKTIYRAIRE